MRRIPTLLLAFLATCFAGQLYAQFTASPSTVDFGRVAIGEQAERTIQIDGEFTATLTIESDNPAFEVSPSRFQVTPASPGVITVTFTPLEAVDYTGEIAASISEFDIEVPVMGEGFVRTGPACQIRPQNSEYVLPYCFSFFLDSSIDIDVRVTVDGEPVAGLEVELREDPDELLLEDSRTTGTDGIARFSGTLSPSTNANAVRLTASGSVDGEEFLCRGSVKLAGSPQALIEALISFYCGIECLFEANQNALGPLRRFRDEVLSRDDRGRDYASQYYEFTPEILRIMAADPKLALRAREQLERHTPRIRAILNGQPGKLSQEDLTAILDVIEAFEHKASAEFRAAIERLKMDLKEPAFLARFGFEIAKPDRTPKPARPSVTFQPMVGQSGTISRVQRDATYGKLPFSFESNEGQAGVGVDYLSRAPGFQLYLRPHEAVLAAGPKVGALTQLASSAPSGSSIVRMRLVGADETARPTGLEQQRTRSHYLMGSDPDEWLTDVPHYARVRYEDVYPDIDVAYYGHNGLLEYDFVVAAGANPERIRILFEGVQDARLEPNGDLLLSHVSGDLTLKKPLVYQKIAGTQREIAGSYAIDNGSIGFGLGDYDPAYPLVIDPILSYSSFVGGSANEISMDVAVDRDGSAYLTGATTSADFAVASSLGNGLVGGGDFGSDGFVVKLNPEGTEMVYATYFGGGGDEIGLGLAVDAFDNVFVAGATSSSDFPTAATAQAAFGGGGPVYGTDAFVLKLDATGAALVFSTYLGGEGDDGASAVAVNSRREVFVTGATASAAFPIENALQPALAGGAIFGSDAFVTKLDADGALVYSTYLGGSGDEAGVGIAVDSANAYITGVTYSEDYPLSVPLQDVRAGGTDAFISKINENGDGLVYSTYLGGSSDDFGLDIDIDSSGNAYLTGLTGSSSDFPLEGPAQESFGSEDGVGFDAFVTKLNGEGSALVYSTYLGGSGREAGFGIAVDSNGNAFVAGETASADFPALNAIQALSGGMSDGFVAKLDAAGAAFDFSSYLGGSNDDFVGGIALDRNGNAYVGGGSGSEDSPVTFGAVQTSSAGGAADALVAKIIEGEPPPAIATVLTANGILSVSPGSIASGFGQALAGGTLVATEIPLPTELGGVSVRITDAQGAQHLAQLFFVSPGQLNFSIPDGLALGLALVEVLQAGEVIATGTVQIGEIAPGIFTANADGQGAPAALYLRFRGTEQTAQEFTFDTGAPAGQRGPVLIDFGAADEAVYITLFGTGMRGGSVISATIDGEEVPISAIFAHPDFIGLDQANVGPILRAMIGRGVVELRVLVDGVGANVVLVSL